MLVAALLLVLAVPVSAATPPTVPFDSTADLLVLENGCDCIVEIDEDGLIRVVATATQIAAVDPEAADEFDVDFNEAGLAFDAAGTGYFVNTGTNSILTLAPDDTLGLLIDGTTVDITGDVELEKLAIAPDGTIYVIDEDEENVLAVVPSTGDVSIFAAEADFEALAGVSDFDLEGGIAVDASGTVYVTSDGSPDAVFSITPDGATVSLLASEPDEVQSVLTTATAGTFTLTFAGQQTAPIAFDASAADLQAALEALSNVDPGDVTVRGEGTTTVPWIVTFTGALGGADQPSMTADTTGLSGGSVSIDEEVEGAAFDDLDLWATLDADGLVVITDDNPATVFRISPTGEITALATDIEFSIIAGDDLEGGIAYDEDGVLYISEEDSGNILAFENGALRIAHSAADIQAATADESPELDGGIAFRMPIVDISPTITAPADANAGDTLTYTVAVTNTGDDTLDAMTLDTGANLQDVSITVDAGTLSGTSWTGDLASGGTVTFTVEGTVPSDASGTIDLTATSTAALGAIDTDTSNDSDAATVALTTSADLAITATGPESLAVEGSGDLTLTITNNGPSDASDVVVVDTLPAGVVLTGSAADEFSCVEDQGTVTCTRDSLAAGASATIVLRVTTDELDCTQAGPDAEVECTFDGEALDELVNAATVSSATSDPDDANDAASSTTVLDTSAVDVDLPAAGATTDQLALVGIASVLLGLVLLRRTPRTRPTSRRRAVTA